MIKYNIIDNFLDQSIFNKMVNDIMPNEYNNKTDVIEFPWVYSYLQTSVVVKDREGNFQSFEDKGVSDIELLDSTNQQFFYFLFYKGTIVNYFHVIEKLIDKINPIAIFRIQANLTLRQSERKRTRFHTDSPPDPEDNLSMTTSILYMNTTNGPTILEDGTEIECIANRIVTFPYDTYHAGVTCTDQPYRIVINLNCFGTKKLWYKL